MPDQDWEDVPFLGEDMTPRFDLRDLGALARDNAIRQVDRPRFSQMVCRIIQTFSLGHKFTTDEIWERIINEKLMVPNEPRAMGAAMKLAQKVGLCAPTDEFVPTRRPQAHKSPQRVWLRVGQGG